MTFPLQAHWMEKRVIKLVGNRKDLFWVSYNTRMQYGVLSGVWVKYVVVKTFKSRHMDNDIHT